MNATSLQRTCELLGGVTFPRCESASLRLEKFVRLGDKTKKDEVDAVVRKPQQKIPQFRPNGAISFTAKLGGRLIVNQAGGVLENAGLCLHPHFNAPYIPGSAVKGCARHAAWLAWNEAEEGESKLAAAKEVAEIFGFPTGEKELDDYLKVKCGSSAAQSGKVAFLAAVPETTAPLVADVVTCHHPGYYAGQMPEAIDCESPIPNVFPCVERDVRFVFSLVPCGADHECLLRAKHWLVVALTENGIGAKTAAGYGWFVYDETAEIAREEAFAKREAEKKAAAEKAAAERAAAEEAAAARAARQALPLLDQWAGDGGAAAVCGKGGKAFAQKWGQASDEQRSEVVKAFQAAEGLGHDVWLMLRTDKKRKNPDAVGAVFKFAKDHGLGRIPQ